MLEYRSFYSKINIIKRHRCVKRFIILKLQQAYTHTHIYVQKKRLMQFKMYSEDCLPFTN